MRVILDVNVFVSYLLTPDPARTITRVVEACLAAAIELIVPSPLLTELSVSVHGSDYLRQRISAGELDNLIARLRIIGETPPEIEDELQSYTRDPEDDYLVAYGLVSDVDYLVTGDPDLLVLGQVSNLRIVEPRRFVAILRQGGLIG
jgi:uncharacterized protein